MTDRMIEGFTEAEARSMLTEYKAAYRAVATGQAYSIEGRSLTRADMKDIKGEIRFLAGIVERFERGQAAGVRVFRGVPRDE